MSIGIVGIIIIYAEILAAFLWMFHCSVYKDSD